MGILSNIKTRTLLIFLGIIFLVVSVGFKGGGLNTLNDNLISFSTFMFGIFVAFAIANAHDKIRKVNEAIKDEEGNTLFIYKSLSLWDEEVKQKALTLIDAYLIDQLDYYLWDFKLSSKSFMKLFDFILNLDCKNESQRTLYGSLVDVLADSLKKRKQVESLVTERMTIIEWSSVILLLLANIIYIFNINDGSLISIVSTILLSTTSIIFVLILRDLDSLKWKESTWIWEPLNNLFKELGLLPYYPEDVIKTGRIKINKGEKIRIAEYKNKYPDMTGKSIKEIEV